MKSTVNILSMKILILDDSANSSSLLKAILNKELIQDVFSTTNLDTAYELLDTHKIDLILLSYVLPEINGTEVCRRISSNMLYEDIPIIMVTANSDIQTLQLSFENGAVDYISKPFNGKELISRVQAHLIRKHVVDKRKQTAITDPLTNIYNRRHFDTVFDHFHTRALSESKGLSFFMIDIDNFKKYNDNYGHQKGDEALKAVATVLQEQLHRTDDYLFRIGGEEFAVILYDTEMDFIHTLSDKIHKALSLLDIEHKLNEEYKKITVSIGVFTAMCRDDITKFEIYDRADKALYTSKSGGRSQTTFTEI